MKLRRSIATVGATGALVTGSLMMASPAQAAPQVVVGGGLVNVQIVDAVDVVIRDVDVAVAAALNIAANVCGIQVAALAADFAQDQEVNCENAVTGRSVAIA